MSPGGYNSKASAEEVSMRRIHRSSVPLAGLVAIILASMSSTPTRFVRADDPKPVDPKPVDPKPADPAPAAPGMDEPAMDGTPMGPTPAPDPAAPDAGAPAAPATPAPAATVAMKDAMSELDRLKAFLKKGKSETADILASLDAVANAILHVVPDVAPAPDDAAGLAAFEKEKDRFMKIAEGLLLDAFEISRVKPGSKTATNERDDVNVKAAQILGTCRPDVTMAIINSLETKIFKAKDYTPPTALYDEAFKSIGLLGHKEGGKYLLSWIKYDNSPNQPDRIKAAFEAMVFFKNFKGLDRLDAVKTICRTFAGVEHAAEVNKTKEDRAQKQVWDKIKPAVIKATQVFAKEPKDKNGNQMGSIKALDEWFRDNDRPKNPVWVDPKPEAPAPGAPAAPAPGK